jgi:hypothetical protein
MKAIRKRMSRFNASREVIAYYNERVQEMKALA